jgi:hypothetical protein
VTRPKQLGMNTNVNELSLQVELVVPFHRDREKLAVRTTTDTLTVVTVIQDDYKR